MKNRLVLPKNGMEGGMDREFRVSRYKLLYIYIYIWWMKNKILLHSRGNCIPVRN